MVKQLIWVIAAAAVLQGCVTPPTTAKADTRPYDPTKSRALNIWEATGMTGQIRDAEIPTSDVKGFFDTGTGKVLSTYANVGTSSLAGLSPGLIGGLSVFASMETIQSTRPSLMVWKKKDGTPMAAVQDQILTHISTAVKDNLERQGFTVMAEYKHAAKLINGITATITFKGGEYCTADKNDASAGSCGVLISLPGLSTAKGSARLGQDPNSEYWVADASNEGMQGKFNFYYSGYSVSGSKKPATGIVFDEVGFMTSVTNDLKMEDIYIYVAPNSYLIGSTTNTFPFIINNGDILAFIKPSD